jgi:hypothetical protein
MGNAAVPAAATRYSTALEPKKKLHQNSSCGRCGDREPLPEPPIIYFGENYYY